MNLFLLVLLTGAGLEPTRGSFTPPPAEEPHLLTLRTRTIDTRQEPMLILDSQEETLPRRFIVHLDHRIRSEDRRLLEAGGLRIESYLPQSGFLVYGLPADAAELLAQGAIDWYGSYLASDKLDPRLFERTQRTRLEVMLFPEEDMTQAVAMLEELGAEIVAVSEGEYTEKLIVELEPDAFLEAAALDCVRWIEPWFEVKLFNDQAQWVTQTWKRNNRRVWDEGLHGEGVIGSTCDSGIRTDHVMFADSSIEISTWGDYPEHRKIIAYKRTTSGVHFGDDGSMFIQYHGTHTGGTVCGDDSYWEETSPYDGMAPKARLYFLDFDGYGYGITPDYRTMYQKPYTGNTAGQAKFMSNSWGQGSGYNSHAWESDHFMWQHPEFLLFFSAGNNEPVISAPATAKNMVTVGATQNGTSATNAAGFSNPGPTADGRVKPDVMAPGENVWSASGAGTDTYHSLSGTSMSCPAAAGATALLVQYLREGWYPTGSPTYHDAIEPSAALLKAMLIVSTDADFPSQPIPHGKIGWGRVDLDSVLYFAGDQRKLFLYDDTLGVETGEEVSFEIGVQSNDWPLRVALVWTDAPPELSADHQLVNDLNLEVRTPSGQLYYGNNFLSNYSRPNGTPDAINVVEMVRIEKPSVGTWNITVKGIEIPEGPQPYALVITGDMEYHDVNLTSGGTWIDDAASANPNGGLDPGETVMLHPIVANLGTYDASAVTGVLSSEDDRVSILSSSADYGDIPAGGDAAGDGFSVKASSSLPEGETVIFQLTLEANSGGYVRTLEYPVIAGLGVDEQSLKPILSLEVMQSPFADHIGVRFEIPQPSPVRLELFDGTGRLVRTLLDEEMQPAGVREYLFAATDAKGTLLPNGVYFVRLATEQGELVCKGLRIK